MVSGRVGSAISAELGSMVVSQQIDAMRALGTSPVRKLVTPRIVALVIYAAAADGCGGCFRTDRRRHDRKADLRSDTTLHIFPAFATE